MSDELRVPSLFTAISGKEVYLSNANIASRKHCLSVRETPMLFKATTFQYARLLGMLDVVFTSSALTRKSVSFRCFYYFIVCEGAWATVRARAPSGIRLRAPRIERTSRETYQVPSRDESQESGVSGVSREIQLRIDRYELRTVEQKVP